MQDSVDMIPLKAFKNNSNKKKLNAFISIANTDYTMYRIFAVYSQLLFKKCSMSL